MLLRTKASRSQVGLSFDERRKNVAKVFQVTPEGFGHIAGRRILLVDDVLTTGATAGSCAAVLKKAGAAHVDVLTFALVLEPRRPHIELTEKTMANITIYTTRTCSYCYTAKSLLTKKGLSFDEIDVSGDPAERQRMMLRANGRRSVPQIFIGETHVGGSEELLILNAAAGLTRF